MWSFTEQAHGNMESICFIHDWLNCTSILIGSYLWSIGGQTLVKQRDSMLPWVCTVINHRKRQYMSDTLGCAACATLLSSPYILASSGIYYWTSTLQHGIYLLNIRNMQNVVDGDVIYASVLQWITSNNQSKCKSLNTQHRRRSEQIFWH